MMAPYTKVHFDFDSLSWLTSPREKLGLEAVGLGLINLPLLKGTLLLTAIASKRKFILLLEVVVKYKLMVKLLTLFSVI